MNRTPTPWNLEVVYGKAAVWDSQGMAVYPFVDFDVSESRTDIHAINNIVAAVNACSGIPTEALEQGAVAKLVEGLKRWTIASHCDCETYPKEALCIHCEGNTALAMNPQRNSNESPASIDHDATNGES